ncbi:MAG: hypothetical protein DMG11_18990 [Acidobacteria bacterium]|nr:MAG: hypothetical protein DMG11_18990 [Acidobacteriota bacterium]
MFTAALAPPAISDWSEPDPEFVFARLACSNRESWMHWPNYWPDNPPWHHDFPSSDEFLVGLLHELTGVRVTPNSYKIVQLSSDEVFKYPFLYLSEPGFLKLNDKEIKNLGEYIRRGGFIMADDFRTAAYLHGPEELEVLRYYLKRALPERELVQIDLSHPIFHSFFDIHTLKMNPPYGDFVPQFWGMSDEHGNLQVIANYNNDIGDFWKYLDHGDKPLKDSSQAIRLGINYIVYAMTH